MAGDPQLRTAIARLLAEVDVDARALAARAAETRQLLAGWTRAKPLPRPELMLVATNLHGYYTALETLCERVARQLDETVPTGPSWHAELLSQMQVEVPGLRPRVIAAEAAAELQELRKFRHFFRNAYVLEFDPALIRGHAERLDRIHDPVANSIDGFVGHLRQVLQALD
ncbi:MAG: hypothetical protein IPK26_23315 [Planctomycetes bacterium]|nr:hypothetical protein [Planctomycetota bacterium]